MTRNTRACVAPRLSNEACGAVRDRGHHTFIPIAIETLGPFCVEGQSFIREIGRRTTAITSDLREAAFLFQRLSLAVQRYNAICIAGTFPNVKSEAGHTQRLTLSLH